MNICVDVDDVIRDFVPEVVREYNMQHGTHYNINQVIAWEVKETLPKMGDFRDWIFKNYTVLLNAPPIKGSIETLKELKKMNNINIYIATNQFKGLEALTVKWLNMHDVPYDGLFFSRNKFMLNGDVLIDDKIGNLEKFNGRKILIDKPWNQSYQGTRIKSLSDIFKEDYNLK